MEPHNDTQETLRQEKLKRIFSRSALQIMIAVAFDVDMAPIQATRQQYRTFSRVSTRSLIHTNMKPNYFATRRHYKRDYPDLEAALFEWQQRVQKKDAAITQDILKAKTERYGIVCRSTTRFNLPYGPKAGSWLSRYQQSNRDQTSGETTSLLRNLPPFLSERHVDSETRNKIKTKTNMLEGTILHYAGDRCITTRPKGQTRIIELLRSGISPYIYIDHTEENPDTRDILNMDETGLFWKLTSDQTLAIQAISGGKRSKDRITAVSTTYADGSEKFEP
ncbi:hypothetical protein GcM3_180027 [Golovinomyces cichoracearum]|uniref:HTH CENPB-type domain-containing protein n=1 Tax=Golovinomyces cichoracearum TaxID=62708 RepID=A0A420HMH1_9PEZI|nr:hypothetical protein GcM3_180027 [Golovinomyces cichoracearum]